MKKLFAIFGSMMLLGLVIAGCGADTSTGNNTIDDALASQLVLPDGAVLESATISIFGFDPHGATVNVHRVTTAWTEGSVTYNTFGNGFDPAIHSSFLADATQWYDIDVKDLVQGWVDEDFENHGILLEQGDTEYTRFFSSEYTDNEDLQPKLEICYTLDGETICFTLQRAVMGIVEDSYISEQDPDFGAGVLPTFFTGNLSGIVKMALLKFDMDEEPDTTFGCTRTIGFWKRHAGFGPQRDVVSQYLPITLGDEGGEESRIINTNLKAFRILKQRFYGHPHNGITKLYAQLLAAKLNFAAGADGSDISGVVADADAFLADHDYTAWYSLDSDTKNTVLSWKTTLDNYNKGNIGPGHCDSMDNDDDDNDNDDGCKKKKKRKWRDNWHDDEVDD